MASKSNQSVKGLILFFNHRVVFDCLEEAERGRLLTDLFNYAEYGELPVYSGDTLRMAFQILQQDVDRNAERYAEICAARSAAGKKSAALRAANHFAPEVSYEDDNSEASTFGINC